MRIQELFIVAFCEGSPFGQNVVLKQVKLPTPPTKGSYVNFEDGRVFHVHAVMWQEFRGDFIVRVYLDKFPG